MLGVLWVILLRRHGWSLACITMRLDARDLLRGVGLLVPCCVVNGLAMYASVIAFSRGDVPGRCGAPQSHLLVNNLRGLDREPYRRGVRLPRLHRHVLRRRGALSANAVAVAAGMAIHIYQAPLQVVGTAASEAC